MRVSPRFVGEFAGRLRPHVPKAKTEVDCEFMDFKTETET